MYHFFINKGVTNQARDLKNVYFLQFEGVMEKVQKTKVSLYKKTMEVSLIYFNILVNSVL